MAQLLKDLDEGKNPVVELVKVLESARLNLQAGVSGNKNFPFHVQVLTEDGEREYLKKDEPEFRAVGV